MLLAQYIWHVSTTSAAIPRGNNQGSVLDNEDYVRKGSYGKVFKCNYTHTDGSQLKAACKKCKIKDGAEPVFEREIQTLSHLKHLFVVEHLGVVIKNAKKYMVIELCEGSLKEYVLGKLELRSKDMLDDKIIISQVVLGMAYIHSKKIIHKDLKLENILLKRQSPESHLLLAKIADFGFAKELKPNSFSFSSTNHPGTTSYMAPELLRASPNAYPANFASDVYALGITIARIALKGRHPFTDNENLRRHLQIQGLIPPTLHHQSWDLIDLIIKLTAKEPAKRPIMALVLCHPYFVLTNAKTKRHFVDHLWTHIKSKENKENSMKQMFNSHNFQEWYRTVTADTQETVEEAKEKKEIVATARKLHPKSTIESLYGPAKQYKQKTTDALKTRFSQPDCTVESLYGPVKQYKQKIQKCFECRIRR
ncbi:serine/threonine-protein kinase 3-like [Daphnia carinata]|uniref:serine/threonine-protein kinase 3-like n=1 Tax=Daphnia carinata TaxID=120202 RepID=UPI0028693715|nr:serine/threonine-protein kinase 3-like [Daphnia carinata]